MATRENRGKTPHQRLDEAGRYIAKLEKRVKALEGQLDEAFKQIDGFTRMVREQSSSIQKAQQGNYRNLDRRIAALEHPQTQAEKELDDALADLPMNER